jgi:hypothetical protein
MILFLLEFSRKNRLLARKPRRGVIAATRVSPSQNAR